MNKRPWNPQELDSRAARKARAKAAIKAALKTRRLELPGGMQHLLRPLKHGRMLQLDRFPSRASIIKQEKQLDNEAKKQAKAEKKNRDPNPQAIIKRRTELARKSAAKQRQAERKVSAFASESSFSWNKFEDCKESPITAITRPSTRLKATSIPHIEETMVPIVGPLGSTRATKMPPDFSMEALNSGGVKPNNSNFASLLHSASFEQYYYTGVSGAMTQFKSSEPVAFPVRASLRRAEEWRRTHPPAPPPNNMAYIEKHLTRFEQQIKGINFQTPLPGSMDPPIVRPILPHHEESEESESSDSLSYSARTEESWMGKRGHFGHYSDILDGDT